MPFIGKQSTSGFASLAKQTLTADGSTTVFTLNEHVASANSVEVFVGNVRQEPTVAYTTSGNALTFASAPASGVDVYVIFQGGLRQSETVPQAGTTVPGAFGVSGDLTTTNILPTLDATSDLGSTTNRYQDLYLSGGVYLGGTGSANKLDDYEEGTWTITNGGDSTGVIAANASGQYVKIGKQVTVQGIFQVSTNFSDSRIGGLPFTPTNASNVVSSIHAVGRVMYSSSFTNIRISDGSLLVSFEDDTGGNINPSTTNDPFRFMLTYITA